MVKDILAIGGQPGLYRLVSQAKNGIIVESLVDGKRMPAYAASKISALEDIAIYTDIDDIPLAEVFISIFEKGLSVDPKSDSNSLKNGFKEAIPNYDADRVYVSDMKKVFAWYRLLAEKELITKEIIATYREEKEKEEAELSENS